MKKKAAGVSAIVLVSSLLAAAPVHADESAVPTGRGAYVFRCSDNEQLRILFNANDHRAVVRRIRRATITLQQVDASDGFRFTRGDNYELVGNTEQISWRAGGAQPIVCHRGER